MQLPSKRVAIYARVSTVDQTCEPQLRDLRAYVTARRWQAIEFVDQGVSGTKEKRPALDCLLREVKARRIDVVVVAAFDRFSRSVRHLVETLELFRHLGVEFVSLREQIDTGSPLGQAVFTIVAAIAELERSLIAERVRAGLRRARAEGRRLGRPPVAVDPGRLASAIRRNLPVREAARQLGISASTYHRLVRAQATAQGDGPAHRARSRAFQKPSQARPSNSATPRCVSDGVDAFQNQLIPGRT